LAFARRAGKYWGWVEEGLRIRLRSMKLAGWPISKEFERVFTL
jgi:hypothetical protein